MNDEAQPFLDMAERISRMAAEFAGAVVIVPPGDGEPITFLLTDPSPSLPQFWSGLQSRVELSALKAQQDESGGPMYGGNRR